MGLDIRVRVSERIGIRLRVKDKNWVRCMLRVSIEGVGCRV